MEIDHGACVAGLLVLRDADGLRHAVRVGAVLGVHESDDGAVVLTLSGARILRLDTSFEAVLSLLGRR